MPDDIADPVPAQRVLDSVNPFSWLSAARHIKAAKPDMLLTKFWMPFMAPSLGTVSGKLKDIPRICIVDNAIPHEKRPGDMQLIRYFLKRQSGFIVMSDTVEQDLRSFLPKAKVLRCEHPLYDHFGEKQDKTLSRKALGLPENKKILLFFGFIRRYKGLHILIESLQYLPSDFHVVIAGEIYGDFAEYQQLINDKGLQDRISLFVRYIGDNETPAFFSAADACVLPYISATQSGIVAIAHHFSLPVIATDVGSLKASLMNGRAGMIVPEAQPEVLAKYIHTFFSKPEYAAGYAMAVQELKQQFSWKNLAQAITTFAPQCK